MFQGFEQGRTLLCLWGDASGMIHPFLQALELRSQRKLRQCAEGTSHTSHTVLGKDRSQDLPQLCVTYRQVFTTRHSCLPQSNQARMWLVRCAPTTRIS